MKVFAMFALVFLAGMNVGAFTMLNSVTPSAILGLIAGAVGPLMGAISLWVNIKK